MQYMPMIKNASRKLPPTDQEDFVQAVCLHALERREAFDPEQGSFATWLFWAMRSVRSLARSRYHRLDKKTMSMTATADADGDDMDFDNMFAADEADPAHVLDLARVAEMLATIKNGDLLLRLAEGATLSELSADLGISNQAIEQKTARARSRLLEALGEPDPVGDARKARRAANHQRKLQADDRVVPSVKLPPVLMRSTASLTRLHDLLAQASIMPSRNPHNASVARV
jgi:RNA polymerase sigma factor (sigma-70 family)